MYIGMKYQLDYKNKKKSKKTPPLHTSLYKYFQKGTYHVLHSAWV